MNTNPASKSLSHGVDRTPWRGVFHAVAVASLIGFVGSSHAQQTPAAKKVSAASTVSTLKSCSWDRPGKNPYMGELPAAIDRYTDLSPDVRARLKDRIAKQQFDDMVDIRRDTIVGGGKLIYAAQIRDMHFGDKGRMCSTVSRQLWKANTTERGLVYCESGHCVMVPTVCRNVSRVAARPVDVAVKPAAPVAAVPAETPSPAVVLAKPDGVPIPAAAPPVAVIAGGAPGASFADVVSSPIFVPPAGPSGTSSVFVPGGSPGTGGAGTGPGGIVGAGAVPGGTGGAGGAGAVPGGTVDPGTAPPTGVVPGVVPGMVPGVTPPFAELPPETSGPVVMLPPMVDVPPGGVMVIPPVGVPTPGVVGGESVVSPIPEPSTWALMLGGLLALAVMSRRRRALAASTGPSAVR